MNFISTRGQAPTLGFEDVVLTGLATDGGLYVPEKLPQFSPAEIQEMASLDYKTLAFKVMHPFVQGVLTDDELTSILHNAYQDFRHPAIAPLVQTGHQEWVLELFQGPTLAFKDFALQFLGHLLDFLLQRRNQRAVVLGATSGDTGSAAIEGCSRCDHLDIFILHPHERVSEVQRRQMTTVTASNVHNLAIRGNFDDCQSLVKQCFRDQSFLAQDRRLIAVNSINWARIMAQIVYYFYAATALGAPNRAVSFSVPTGNFGDIFAGYLAHGMGLPVEKLIIATNANDILHRCLSANDHSRRPLQHSLSPSMDIMVSSNFERLLFDLYQRDGDQVQGLIEAFDSGHMPLSDAALTQARELFASFKQEDPDTLETIQQVFQESGYLLDPHSAIGVAAARSINEGKNQPVVCLATAHPAKFPEAILKAGMEQPELPPHMADLFDRSEQYTVVDNDLQGLQNYVAKHTN